jgi:hypothetical protein
LGRVPYELDLVEEEAEDWDENDQCQRAFWGEVTSAGTRERERTRGREVDSGRVGWIGRGGLEREGWTGKREVDCDVVGCSVEEAV